MKFLCDNCKAKYQVGDEKVAGKAVRMKCRRCGYDIHVSASFSDAGAVSSSSDVWDTTPSAPVKPTPAPAPQARAHGGLSKISDEPSAGDDENTAVMTFASREAVLAAKSGAAPAGGTPTPSPRGALGAA